MRILLAVVMISNAVVFFLAAVLHAGIALGALHEPRIIPATIVEVICGISLAWGVLAVLNHRASQWRFALIGNLVALGGVLLGMAALAAGKGPRTASNDLYHRSMLVLITASVVTLLLMRNSKRSVPHAED
jgi:hypothetical protein